MEIKQIEVKDLKPWEKNPRVNDQAVDAVAKSIQQFGFNVPILCDQDMTIIAGHVRWKAAKKLGLVTIPVIQLSLTAAQRDAFSIADNKTSEIADWDYDLLADILKELPNEEIDFSSLGFNDAELDAILKPEVDFDWDAFREDLEESEGDATHVLLPVKVPIEAKQGVSADSRICSRARDCAERQGAVGGSRDDVAPEGVALLKPLETKVQETIRYLRGVWPRLRGRLPFVAFSTGKDSLAMAAMLYEAIEPEKPICLYSHHNLEFASNLDYLEELRNRGFVVEVVNPFLEYFDLMERGIGFLTRKDPWCVPMLVATGILGWLQDKGLRSPKEAVMFRGMSGSEYSHKFHTRLELYGRLDLPTFNPVLSFTKDEIIEVVKSRYCCHQADDQLS